MNLQCSNSLVVGLGTVEAENWKIDYISISNQTVIYNFKISDAYIKITHFKTIVSNRCRYWRVSDNTAKC